ncbi:MAG TPA: acylphosphatase [Casimicrobiaceae bacterium]|jgi:acylphosphatase
MIAKRALMRGRVQGVGFRFAMVDAARDAQVVGWVRNRRDGTVEAFVQGDAAGVERIVEWCRRGPPGARVADFEATDTPVDSTLRDFSQRPSA